jgi:hypothetical protein
MSNPYSCYQFSMMLGSEFLPELLRKVAAEIERIDNFQLLNLVVDEVDGETTAHVYYWIDSETLGVAETLG